MPIPGAKYRVITTPKGHKIRLAFVGTKVVETTPMPVRGHNPSSPSHLGFARLRPSRISGKAMED